jgi:hypothetical protein
MLEVGSEKYGDYKEFREREWREFDWENTIDLEAIDKTAFRNIFTR